MEDFLRVASRSSSLLYYKKVEKFMAYIVPTREPFFHQIQPESHYSKVHCRVITTLVLTMETNSCWNKINMDSNTRLYSPNTDKLKINSVFALTALRVWNQLPKTLSDLCQFFKTRLENCFIELFPYL